MTNKNRIQARNQKTAHVRGTGKGHIYYGITPEEVRR